VSTMNPDELARLQQLENERALRRLRAGETARDVLREERRNGLVIPEPVRLDALLAQPAEPILYRIAGWWPVNGRVILAAARKAGKTTITGNIAQVLADTWLAVDEAGTVIGGQYQMFLGYCPVYAMPGSIAVIDNEMNPQMLRRWYADLGVANPNRIMLWTLRGQGRAFDILDPDVRAGWAVKLRAVNASVLILDCLAPALGALGLTESNEDVNKFLVAFDALLIEAGVREALIAHHMGHLEERSRGASRLRDWPEVEWRLVRERNEDGREVDNGSRFLAAYGRDVDVPESRLIYDPVTRRLTMVAGSRVEHKLARWLPTVQAIVTDDPGIQTNPLKEKLRDATGVSRAETLADVIRQAERHGLIRIEREGPGKPNHHFVASAVAAVPPIPGDSA
jgi:AAA domain